MIAGVNEVTGAIARAVDMQREATEQMDGDIKIALDESQGVSDRVAEVAATISLSSKETEAFKSVSVHLEDVISNMEQSVHAFLDAVEQDLGARRKEMQSERDAA